MSGGKSEREDIMSKQIVKLIASHKSRGVKFSGDTGVVYRDGSGSFGSISVRHRLGSGSH